MNAIFNHGEIKYFECLISYLKICAINSYTFEKNSSHTMRNKTLMRLLSFVVYSFQVNTTTTILGSRTQEAEHFSTYLREILNEINKNTSIYRIRFVHWNRWRAETVGECIFAKKEKFTSRRAFAFWEYFHEIKKFIRQKFANVTRIVKGPKQQVHFGE